VWLHFLSSRSRIALLLRVLLRDIIQFDRLAGDDCIVLLSVDWGAVASEASGAVCKAVLVEEDACQENAPLASMSRTRKK
jgi:hypothetical protein